MKRSHCPSVLEKNGLLKKPKIEEEEEPKNEVIKRELRARNGTTSTTPSSGRPPSDEFIDIARKKRAAPKKKKKEESDEEEELELPSDDDEEEEKSEKKTSTSSNRSLDCEIDLENEICESLNGENTNSSPEEEEEAEPEPGGNFFEVVYFVVDRFKKEDAAKMTGVLEKKDDWAFLLSSVGKITAKCQTDYDFFPGMKVKIGNKEIIIGKALSEMQVLGGMCFLRGADEVEREVLKEVNNNSARPSWLKTSNNTPFRLKGVKRKYTGFITPFKGQDTKVLRNKLEPLFPIEENSVVVYKPVTKVDKLGRPLVPVVVDPFIGTKLRPHQREGIKFLFECVMNKDVCGGFRNFTGCGAILADEMGLGKTIQSVTLVYTLLRQGPHGDPSIKKALIVAPSSLVKNWQKEFVKWLGDRVRVSCIAETTKKGDSIIADLSLPYLRGGSDVLVISYDQFRKYSDKLQKVDGIDLIVCDEGHRLKNDKIKTAQALDAMPTKRRIILSGTPIQNHLNEFYAMVNFVNPNCLGKETQFKQLYEIPINAGREPGAQDEEKKIGKARSEELSSMTSNFILRRTADINSSYLPSKLEIVLFCKPSKLQQDLYFAMTKSNLEELKSVDGHDTLRLITALKKLCNHPELIHQMKRNDKDGSNENFLRTSIEVFQKANFNHKNFDPHLSGKMEILYGILAEMVAQTDDRIVIVSNYTQTLDVLQILCTQLRLRYFRLDGATVVGKRQTLVDQFNESNIERVFLLSSKAGGVGLNLVGANRLVLFDPDWNPAADLQAMARVWRDGQKKQVYIYRMLTVGTIEEKIFQRQVTKQGLSSSVVDEKTTVNSLFSLKDLRNLFELKTKESNGNDFVCETHELLFCTCHVKEQKISRRQLFLNENKRMKGGMNALAAWDHHKSAESVDDDVLKAASKKGTSFSFAFSNLEKGEIVTK